MNIHVKLGKKSFQEISKNVIESRNIQPLEARAIFNPLRHGELNVLLLTIFLLRLTNCMSLRLQYLKNISF